MRPVWSWLKFVMVLVTTSLVIASGANATRLAGWTHGDHGGDVHHGDAMALPGEPAATWAKTSPTADDPTHPRQQDKPSDDGKDFTVDDDWGDAPLVSQVTLVWTSPRLMPSDRMQLGQPQRRISPLLRPPQPARV